MNRTLLCTIIILCGIAMCSWKSADGGMSGARAQSYIITSGIVFQPSGNVMMDVGTDSTMVTANMTSVIASKTIKQYVDTIARKDKKYADSVALAMVSGIHAPTFNNGIVRTFNTNYTISTIYPSFFCYSVTVATTINLTTTSSSGSVFPEYSTNGGTTWITLPQVSNSGTLSTLVTLSALSSQSFQVNGWVPANALVRLRTSFTGTVNFTYLNGQEYY